MADRYLKESGAPDGFLLEDGSGVLLLETTTYDPSTGFPYEQSVDFARRTPQVQSGWSALVVPEYEPTDWFPSYPDRIWPLARPVNEGGYFQFNNYFSPNPAPPLSWQPEYPDFARGQFTRPVNVGGLTWTNVEYEPTDWFPSYPDRIWPKPVPVNEGGLAPFVNRETSQLLSWAPDYPDFARGPKPLVATGVTLITIQEREPAVDWLPDYPDFARAARRPVNEGGTSFVNRETSQILAWSPDYPDFARDALRAVNEGGLFRTHLEYEPTDWFPTYPDKIWPKATPVNEGGFVPYNNFFSPNPAPLLSWQPEYPDFARGLFTRAVNEGGTFRTHLEYEPTDWFPSFPDRIWPKPVPVNEGGFVPYVNYFSPNPAPLGSWYPDFPDFARGVFTRPVNEGGTFRTHLEYEPTDWFPDFPAYVWPKPRALNVGGQVTQVQLVAAVVTPLSWSPDFPDFARAAQRPVNVGGSFFVNKETSQLATWLPDYPDFARAAPRPVNVGGASFVKLEREPIVDWLPDYPDFARIAASPLNVGGIAAYVRITPPLPPLTWQPEYPDFARTALRAVNVGGMVSTVRDIVIFVPDAPSVHIDNGIFLKSLELPLPATLTRIYGIHQSDVVLAAALKVAMADMRANPWLLDYVFASLPQDPLTWREYGAKSVAAAKEWFLKTDIPVIVTPTLNELKVPAISIALISSEEVTQESTLGDIHSEAYEENDMLWPALCEPFTPKSYLPSTGTITLKSVPDGFALFPGMFIVDKRGTAYAIVDVLNETTFTIAADTVPDLRDCVIKPSRPAYKVSVESSSFRETYSIGVHVGGEPVYVTWLHSIMVFALLRYKEVLLEARGFERSTINSSDFVREEQFVQENVFSRYIRITGNVRQYWPKTIATKIEGVVPGITVSGENADVLMEGAVDDVSTQLWKGNLDDDDDDEE
jgi:hypothetical protein